MLSFLSHMPIIKPNSFPKHTPALHTTYNWAALSEGKTRGRGPGVPVTWGPRAGAGRLAAKANVSLGRAPTWTPGGCLPQSQPTAGREVWKGGRLQRGPSLSPYLTSAIHCPEHQRPEVTRPRNLSTRASGVWAKGPQRGELAACWPPARVPEGPAAAPALRQELCGVKESVFSATLCYLSAAAFPGVRD